MSYMPSVAFVAQALHAIGADTEWEDASPEEQNSHMAMARVALGAIVSWQQSRKPEGLQRYCCEPLNSEEGELIGWAIYDRKVGFTTRLGVIHDPLLAQQVIDEMNNVEARQQAKKEPEAAK